MLSSISIVSAFIAPLIALIGILLSDRLERSRASRLRNLEFSLDRYQEFLRAFTELSVNRTYETQLHFADATNVILLIGGLDLLNAVKHLVDNYDNEKDSGEKYTKILNRIMDAMRRDLSAADSKHLAQFEFPIIVPDIRPTAEAPHKSRR